MTRNQLLEIITNGENSGVEFKRDDIRPEQLAKEIVAFANFKGGRVLLGVEINGTISGITRLQLEEWVMNAVSGGVTPQIIPYYEEVEIEAGKRVAIVGVESGANKPHALRDGDRLDFFIRVLKNCLASRTRRAGNASLSIMITWHQPGKAKSPQVWPAACSFKNSRRAFSLPPVSMPPHFLELAIYSDRLEIVSPGALPNTVTVEKMKAGVRIPRNPIIMRTMQDCGYVEAMGMGVRNMIRSMLAHNGTEPEFIEAEGRFTVRLWREQKTV